MSSKRLKFTFAILKTKTKKNLFRFLDNTALLYFQSVPLNLISRSISHQVPYYIFLIEYPVSLEKREIMEIKQFDQCILFTISVYK